jgi:hypothetical protein
MDRHWKLRVFMEDGVDVIGAWLANCPVRAEMERILAYMQVVPIWVEPYFKWLKGKAYRDMGEVRKTGRIQYRIVGSKGPGDREFTLLIGCTKTARGAAGRTAWNPSNALKAALSRKKLVLEDRRNTNEYEWPQRKPAGGAER